MEEPIVARRVRSGIPLWTKCGARSTIGPMSTGDPLRPQRRLAAILAADVVGFSRLMGQDEAGTLARVKNLRAEVIEPQVSDHGGRVFKTTGDGFLIEFPSPVEAVECAVGSKRPYTP